MFYVTLQVPKAFAELMLGQRRHPKEFGKY